MSSYEGPGRPPDSVLQAEMRRKALDLYLNGDQGRRLPLRAIAQAVGVHLRTVQNWRKKDKWDEQTREALVSDGGTRAATVESVLRDRMGTVLVELVSHLEGMARKGPSGARIAAIRQYVEIYRKLGGSLDVGKPARQTMSFSDDLETPDAGG